MDKNMWHNSNIRSNNCINYPMEMPKHVHESSRHPNMLSYADNVTNSHQQYRQIQQQHLSMSPESPNAMDLMDRAPVSSSPNNMNPSLQSSSIIQNCKSDLNYTLVIKRKDDDPFNDNVDQEEEVFLNQYNNSQYIDMHPEHIVSLDSTSHQMLMEDSIAASNQRSLGDDRRSYTHQHHHLDGAHPLTVLSEESQSMSDYLLPEESTHSSAEYQLISVSAKKSIKDEISRSLSYLVQGSINDTGRTKGSEEDLNDANSFATENLMNEHIIPIRRRFNRMLHNSESNGYRDVEFCEDINSITPLQRPVLEVQQTLDSANEEDGYEIKEEIAEDMATIANRDSGNSSDSASQQLPQLSDDDPFFHYPSSSSDEEFIPNEIFFGDGRNVYLPKTTGNLGRPRGSFFKEKIKQKVNSGVTDSLPNPSPVNKNSKPVVTIKKDQKKTSKNLPKSLKYLSKNKTEKDLRGKKRKHRLDDPSSHLPNDIYFGDVSIPLHILYSFEKPNSDPSLSSSSSSTESESELENIKTPTERPPARKRGRPPSKKPRQTAPHQDPKIIELKSFLTAAGIKHIVFTKLWSGCANNVERAERIIKLLQEHGLNGEPTLQKCKALGKTLQQKKDLEDLDSSLIIQEEANEGSRRVATRSTTLRRYPTKGDVKEFPDNNKIGTLQNIIDSDSSDS